jgi:hypothetical protein
MKVKAAAGLKCPMEDNPKTYITDDPKGTVVPDTSYYQRLLDDGSLELVPVKTKGGDQ